ncbi:MAG: hypothetical protein O3B90_09950 [Actinomycetota bacterium]|nr:hypothetical protein [Actinomycetota bacterium]
MFASDRERRTVNKFAADLRLSAGDIGPARACRAAATTLDPLAEERHRRLLAGAHVLVVGPAPSSRPTGDQLARADVVAVTKRPLDRSLTACPQLVYPTDASARLDLRPEQLCATQTVVLRPSILRSPSHAAPAFAASRVMPAEDANAYLGTRFGVQRILYDLLHYDPAVIELCGVDFFLAPTPYVEGYTDETDRLYQPNDLQPSMSVAPHDYIWDFSFTKTLHEHGHLTVGPEIQSILRLTPGEYLRQLEAVLTST